MIFASFELQSTALVNVLLVVIVLLAFFYVVASPSYQNFIHLKPSPLKSTLRHISIALTSLIFSWKMFFATQIPTEVISLFDSFTVLHLVLVTVSVINAYGMYVRYKYGNNEKRLGLSKKAYTLTIVTIIIIFIVALSLTVFAENNAAYFYFVVKSSP